MSPLSSVSSIIFILFISLSTCSAVCLRSLRGDTSKTRFEANEALERAEALLKEGRESEALNSFRRAVELFPGSAFAHNKLGEIYMSRGTPSNRYLAKKHFQKALALDRNNQLYNFNLGLLYKEQGFNSLAKKQFKRVVELDSCHAEAYYNLGLLYEEDLFESKDKVIFEEVEPPHTLPTAKDVIVLPYPARDMVFRETVQHYQKALEIDPDFRDALFQLGMVYTDFGREDAAVRLLTRVLDKNRDEKEVRLFLGLAYHRLGKEEEALHHFNDAMALMNSDEWSLYRSIRFNSTEGEEKTLANLGPAEKHGFIEEFWSARDPLLFTDVNERLLEHYSRIAYANLRFGVPNKGIQGCETDRGKVHIRYGNPDHILRVPSMAGGRADEKITPDISLTSLKEPQPFGVQEDPVFDPRLFFPKAELWSYNIDGNEYQFAFEDPFMSGEFVFSASVEGHIEARFPGDYEYEYFRLKRTIPEIHHFDYGGELFAFPWDFTDFRGEENLSRVEIYYMLPIAKLGLGSQKGTTDTVQCGIFISDLDHRRVTEKREERSFHIDDIRALPWDVVVDLGRFDLSPGNYHLVIELRNKRNKKTGRIKNDIFLDSYDSENLLLSDIQLAGLIYPTEREDKFYKKGLSVFPSPTRSYVRSKQIYIYYEIYNLSRKEYGRSHFRIDYTLSSQSGQANVVTRLISGIGKVIGIDKKRGEITISYEDRSLSPTENGYTGIDVENLLPGKYKLTLCVTDLNTRDDVSKSVDFTIIER